MNTASLRRRGYNTIEEKLIEHPDCYCFVFETTEDEATITVGNFLIDFMNWLEIDGVERKITNGLTLQFTLPKGIHTIYLRPYKTCTNRNIVLNGNGTNHITYIRFPYNASTITLTNAAPRVNSWTAVWDLIDVLDPNVVSWINSDPGYQTYTTRVKAFRVPKGCKQKYIDAGFPDSILSKMTEYDFKYKIPE